METLRSILHWLDGKKLHIVNVITIICSFFVSKGYLDAETATFIVTLLGALTSGAQVATIKMGATRKY